MQTLSTHHLLLHQPHMLGTALLDLLVHQLPSLALQLTAHGQHLAVSTVKHALAIPTPLMAFHLNISLGAQGCDLDSIGRGSISVRK